ncbi:hypothetical protein DM860_005822 [Cuscuta australis]|uniref:Uncharacterized protein n=1 Tax=Cuscuta australis TaxID=267555 RepID=A0A328DV18_9ASTE|nr:hypothetical protein DM860_005822 [Cuscuta australis]
MIASQVAAASPEQADTAPSQPDSLKEAGEDKNKIEGDEKCVDNGFAGVGVRVLYSYPPTVSSSGTDIVLQLRRCKPITLTMWDKLASIQGIEIEKGLKSGTWILATSFQGLSLTTRHDSSIELNRALLPVTVIAAIKPSSGTYETNTSNMYSLLSL